MSVSTDFIKSEIERMREASGNVTTADRLEVFLYLLLRDHLPAGAVEKIVLTLNEEETLFTNGWLATYAKDLSKRLRDV